MCAFSCVYLAQGEKGDLESPGNSVHASCPRVTVREESESADDIFMSDYVFCARLKPA